MNTEKLIAHRGDNTNHPENTLIAIETALKAGAVAFEFDVQMNADHTLVAFHDETFLRMSGDDNTNIVDVSDSKMDQISVHEPEQFERKHYPTRVTYFDEVMALLKQYPKAQVFIEIKDDSLKYWGVEFVMAKLLKSLVGFEGQASIISFNTESLFYTKKHSKLKVGLVFDDYDTRHKDIAEKLKPEFMICDYLVLPNENIWKGDWQWMVYTVNEVEIAKSLLKRGDIDFVETDDIQLLLDAS